MAKFRNAFEPDWYIEAFAKEPPQGFQVGKRNDLIYFVIKFNLLTTLDHHVKRWLNFLEPILYRPKTVFLGGTNTEYCCLPKMTSSLELRSAVLELLKENQATCAIVKDLPSECPLLSAEDNKSAAELLKVLTDSGFQIVTGEALAYIPIDFASIPEFMSRFSSNRRHQLKKKLRVRDQIKIEELITGRDKISEELLDRLYGLYEQVYAQSEIHFDKLTKEFFRTILTDGEESGRLFLYSVDGTILSFVTGLVYEERFIYKYIGFDYSRSREFNLYYITWFHMLEYCLRHQLKVMIAGWTDPEIKAYLGSRFSYTFHAVYFRSHLLRWLLTKLKRFFESDKATLERIEAKSIA
jgi:predicted N-acyltransferase